MNYFLTLFFYSSICFASSGMLLIPEGEFFMGRDMGGGKNESPRHLVKISKFYIDETLVSVKDFREFVEEKKYVTSAEEKGSGKFALEGMADWSWQKVDGANWRQPFGPKNVKKFPIKDDHPVVSVSWLDANAFCKWKGKRLPTEAEWEYAARSGKSGIRFPWGNSIDPKDGKPRFNYWRASDHRKNPDADGYVYTSPVKAFPPNEWGMYDAVGNAWQWVADWYSEDYFKEINRSSGVKDPQGPKQGKFRVARGGSWWCSVTTCNGFGLFYRGKAAPSAVYNNNGFRCAKNASLND